MPERWPGEHRFEPPPGLDVRTIRRGLERSWRIEATWTGQPEPIFLGYLPDYMLSHRIDWGVAIDWAAVADDHLPEVA